VSLEATHVANPGAREAHRTLARAVTEIVHGADAAADAVSASTAVFAGKVALLPRDLLGFVAAELPHKIWDPRLSGVFSPIGQSLVENVVYSGLYPSKSQARQAILGGGIYINDSKVTDPNYAITQSDLLYGQHLALRKGQKTYVFISGSAPILPQ
jgi:tyrosyl-tRNA synthetase